MPANPEVLPAGVTPSLSSIQHTQHEWPICRYFKPSDGLEPSTPSLPSWDRRGNRGHDRVTAGTKAPQTEGIRRRRVTRAWTRVDALMFAPRSHELLA